MPSQVETDPKSFANTIAFAVEASAIPLDKKPGEPDVFYPPKPPWQEVAKYRRDWEVNGRYAGGDQTLEEIGKTLNPRLSCERARQIFGKGIQILYEIAPDEVKTRFPWETLSMRKPLTIESRQRFSLARGGRNVRIAQLVEQGQSAQEITTGAITTKQLANARPVLRTWGVEVPYTQERRSSAYQGKLERLRAKDLSFEEKQAIMDIVSRAVYQGHLKGDNPLFPAVSKLATEAGLYPSPKDISIIANILKQEKIAMGLLEVALKEQPGRRQLSRYYFIASSDRERAIALLRTHPDLGIFRVHPVTVLGKRSDKIPIYSQLLNSGCYLSVGSLLGELGHPRLYQELGITTTDLITSDCPVPIFVYQARTIGVGRGVGRNYYYQNDQKNKLRAFLAARVASLAS